MHHQTRGVRGKRPIRRQAILAVSLILLFACAQQQKPAELRLIDDHGIARIPSEHPVVVINFWATWCQPCVEEIPMLVKFHDANHDRIRLVGISMDEAKDESLVRQFLKDHGVSYPVYLRHGSGNFEAMVNSMDPEWIGALPATFVFKQQKRIFSKTGELQASDLQRILEGIS